MVSFNVKINEKVHEVKDVDSSLFVGEVKSMVEIISGVSKDCQKWIYKGRILTDQMTLLESSIVDGNTVIVMKTAAPSQPVPVAAPIASTGGSAGNNGDSSYNQSFTRPLPSTARFDSAMFELLQNSEEAVVQAAVSILLKVISNVILHPSEDKYRRLNKSNTAFSKKVGSVSGGSSCMIALGFQVMEEEWVLVPSADAWDNIVSCKTKLEKFAKRLGDQIATSTGKLNLPVAPAPTSAGSTIADPVAAPADSLSTLEMQQFLLSLSTMQTSTATPLTPEDEEVAAIAAAVASSEQEMAEDDVSVTKKDENEEEEETLPPI